MAKKQSYTSSKVNQGKIAGDQATTEDVVGRLAKGSQNIGYSDGEFQSMARQMRPSDKNQSKSGGSGKWPKYDRMA